MNISAELVDHITRELIKRLNPAAPPPAAAPPAAAPKPLLHLVGRAADLGAPALARLRERFIVREHLDWDEPLPPEASVLITTLNIQALVRVAEGDEGCTVEGRALLAALLNGQPAAALKDGLVWRRYLATAPKALLARYSRCESALLGYGLKLTDEDGAAEALLGRSPAAPPPVVLASARPGPPPARPKPAGGRRVLAESDVAAACPAAGGPDQTLRLSPGDLLTPLAQDYVLAMKINLVRD
jgi:hypothetical protein